MKKYLILLILLVLSCRGIDQESVYEEKLVVYSILNPAFPKQFVIDNRLVKGDRVSVFRNALNPAELVIRVEKA